MFVRFVSNSLFLGMFRLEAVQSTKGFPVGVLQSGAFSAGAIELKYYAPGTWAVTVSAGSACCDSSGNKFDLYYPTNLGANGFLHPILTWGNGSFASPRQYDYFLRHMASWGFVVVATEDFSTGLGQTILDGAKFMIHANGDPTSILLLTASTHRFAAARCL